MSDPARITLSPCPFCGEHPFAPGHVTHPNEQTLWSVFCNHCDDMRVGTGDFETEAEAIAAWNTRPALAQPARAQAGVAELVAQKAFKRLWDWHARLMDPADLEIHERVTMRRDIEDVLDALAALNGGEDDSDVARLTRELAGEREAHQRCSAALAAKDQAMGVLFKRMEEFGVEYEDLMS